VLWHMYYGGADCVDAEKQWFESAAGSLFCQRCRGLLAGGAECPDVWIEPDQKIRPGMDLFDFSRVSHVGIMSARLRANMERFHHALLFGNILSRNPGYRGGGHFAFTAKEPVLCFHGTKPLMRRGAAVPESEQRQACELCGRRFLYSDGQRFLYEDEFPGNLYDVYGSCLNGIVFGEDVYEALNLSRETYRGARLEKIQVRHREETESREARDGQS